MRNARRVSTGGRSGHSWRRHVVGGWALGGLAVGCIAAVMPAVEAAPAPRAAAHEPGVAHPADAKAPDAWMDVGSSGRAARQRALDAIPLERLAEPHRRAVEKCLRAATLYRRLPVETVACEGGLLDFALSKPEAIVDMWHVLGISRLALDPMGPGQWRLADGYGTVGVLRLVHHERQAGGGLLVFHGRGAYTGPLAPKNLTGSCVILVRHSPAMATADGRERHTLQIDSFLDVDGVGLEIVTRTLQPLIVRSAASNLHEICLFMATLSESARRNPEGVAQLAGRLGRTAPADQQALAGIARRAAGQGRPVGGDDTAGERVRLELASRWLPADELEALVR
jgi:hypothetical protein